MAVLSDMHIFNEECYALVQDSKSNRSFSTGSLL